MDADLSAPRGTTQSDFTTLPRFVISAPPTEGSTSSPTVLRLEAFAMQFDTLLAHDAAALDLSRPVRRRR